MNRRFDRLAEWTGLLEWNALGGHTHSVKSSLRLYDVPRQRTK